MRQVYIDFAYIGWAWAVVVAVVLVWKFKLIHRDHRDHRDDREESEI